jgi:hypothetical protein
VWKKFDEIGAVFLLAEKEDEWFRRYWSALFGKCGGSL